MLAAARALFGRDGYARTGVDAIAAEAGVSTRTIYSHFGGKEELFSTVLLESATEVADRFCERTARTMTGADLAQDLIALGAAFAAQRTDAPEHFAMVRRIRDEAPYFPAATLHAWQQAGPERVQRHVRDRLAELTERGLLDIADPARAAAHLSVLVVAERTVRPLGDPPLTNAETKTMVRDGVRAFLTGYGA